MDTFCVNAVISMIINEYLRGPDWSGLITKIKNYKYVNLQYRIVEDPETEFTSKAWYGCYYRILFVNQDSIIVENIELEIGDKRYGIYQIFYNDWDKVFISWVDEDTDNIEELDEIYENGIYYQ